MRDRPLYKFGTSPEMYELTSIATVLHLSFVCGNTDACARDKSTDHIFLPHGFSEKAHGTISGAYYQLLSLDSGG